MTWPARMGFVGIALAALVWCYVVYQYLWGCPNYALAHPSEKLPRMGCEIATNMLAFKMLVVPAVLGFIAVVRSTAKMRLAVTVVVLAPFSFLLVFASLLTFA